MKMRKLTLLLLSCLLMMLCACSNVKDSTDTLRVYVGSDAESLDPAKLTSYHGAIYAQSFLEGLTRTGKEGLPVLAAAKECKVAEDGLTYTFTLRENKWQNGDPVRAQDFEYSWKRTLNPKTAGVYAYMLYDLKGARDYNYGLTNADTVGVKALDDQTLEVKLEHPVPYFFYLCSHQTFFPVNPKVAESNPTWATKAETLIGNGPFKVSKWIRGNKLSLVKNDTYWDAANVKLKNLEYYLLEGSTTVKDMFDNGELDFARGTGKGRREMLKKAGKLYQCPALHLSHYAVDNRKPPFNDVRVRRAFALALDRKKMSDITNDKGEDLSGYGIVPKGIKNALTGKDFRLEAGDMFKEDLAEAKRLMTEAGYSDRSKFPTISLLYNNSESNKEAAEMVQEMLKQNLGVNIELVNQEWKVYLDSKKNRKYHMAQSYWMADYVDPMTFLDLFVTDGGNNDTGYANPKYDELLRLAQNTNDNEKRNQLMHEAEKLIMEEMGTIPTSFGIGYVSLNPKVKGFMHTSSTLYDFTYAYKEK